MKPTKPKLWLVPLICYATALVLYGVFCGIQLFLDTQHRNNGQLQERQLEFEQFYVEGVVLSENHLGGTDLVTIGTDPQMVYSPGVPFYAGVFTFEVETINQPGSEMQLYYTEHEGEDFSVKKRLTAQQVSDGSWFFDLGGRELQALRFDLDTTGGILYRNWAITLGSAKPITAYFIPSASEAFWLLFLPLLASAVIVEFKTLENDFLLRRKAKNKKITYKKV